MPFQLLKSIRGRVEKGRLDLETAADRIEKALERLVDRVEENGRLSALDAADARSYLNAIDDAAMVRLALPARKAIREAVEGEPARVARIDDLVERGRLTSAEAQERLDAILDRRIDGMERRGRIDAEQAEALRAAADDLRDAGDAIADMNGFRKAALAGERFRPDSLYDDLSALWSRSEEGPLPRSVLPNAVETPPFEPPRIEPIDPPEPFEVPTTFSPSFLSSGFGAQFSFWIPPEPATVFYDLAGEAPTPPVAQPSSAGTLFQAFAQPADPLMDPPAPEEGLQFEDGSYVAWAGGPPPEVAFEDERMIVTVNDLHDYDRLNARSTDAIEIIETAPEGGVEEPDLLL
ncbi:MAG: hypothetical protein AAF192_00440 [Pseudomonadota bacterium]